MIVIDLKSREARKGGSLGQAHRSGVGMGTYNGQWSFLV